MGRCPCFGFWKGRKKHEGNESAKSKLSAKVPPYGLNSVQEEGDNSRTFTYRELVTATGDFGDESFIGQGGFGPVYKGHLNKTGQDVAVKKLNKGGHQGDKEFLVEVLMLSLLHHPNLVNLIGYCAEGEQRLLVYEYMPLGSLEDHLHGLTPDMEPLDWNTRMAIAAGAAKGLDYLHNEAKPPVIFRDLKSSNILLSKGFQPKLSDFGLAKFGPAGEKSHVSTRVMGTYGYCAPEYALSGKLTMKSDIYSFGVVLLELITGRRAIYFDQGHARYLVQWALPMMKDRRNFVQLADPGLKGRFPESVLKNAVEVASMCLREEPSSRPSVRELSVALDHLMSQKYEPRRVHGPRLGRPPVALHPVEPQLQESSPAGTTALLNKDFEHEKTA